MTQTLDKQMGPVDVKISITNGQISITPNYQIAGLGIGLAITVDAKVLLEVIKTKINPAGAFAPEEIAAITLLETAICAI